jgi:hypothetical protein
MESNSPNITLFTKGATSDMGFGTSYLVSGMTFGLMGKFLNLYSDYTWDVQNKKGKVISSGDKTGITGVKKVSDGLEITFSAESGKRWLRVNDSERVLPWMGTRSQIEALEGILDYWRSADHSVSIPSQITISSPVKYLGGAGTTLMPQCLGTLWITATGFAIKSGEMTWARSIGELTGLQIGGQGIYTTGGGWFGGGVGFAGAIQGAALAGIMNALETRVHNDCLMRLSFEDAELNFQILDITPRDLELQLTLIRIHLEKNLGLTSTSTLGLSGTVRTSGKRVDKDLKSRLQELKTAFDEGLLSNSEYEAKRSKLLEDL